MINSTSVDNIKLIRKNMNNTDVTKTEINNIKITNKGDNQKKDKKDNITVK